MDYIELYIPCADSLQSEIWVAELSDLPFESFETDEISLKAYIKEPDYLCSKDAVDEFIRSTGVQCRITRIEAVNWNSVWESNFDPVEVDGKCRIRAPFHEPEPGTELDIVIMPKMSFGTGHHATTWLMSDALCGLDVRGLKGLDMGCGTGVLAIIAAKKGAAHMDAVDIDEWSYENSMENIGVNGVENSVTAILGDVSAISGKRYDFILANINRNILLADMQDYAEAMEPGGLLLMSGILTQDIPAIGEEAAKHGLVQLSSNTKDGWAVVTYRLKK